MAWESRQGRKYFYRSVREGGRVRKQYLGAGPAAHEAARQAEQAHEAALADQAAVAKAEAELAPIDQVMDELDSAAELLAQAALLAAGCHEHRGQWRRKRGKANPTPEAAQ